MKGQFLQEVKNYKHFIALNFLLLFFMIFFSEQLHGIFGEKNYISIHIIIEVLIIVTTMSIASQIWLTSRYNMMNKDIFLGALFFSISFLKIAHLISYKGMPHFIYESSPYAATWFYIAFRVFLSVGLLIFLLMKAKKVTHIYRWVAYSFSILFSLAFIFFVYTPVHLLPSLVIDGVGTTILKNMLQFTAATIQFVIILFLIKYFSKAPKRSLLFIMASVYLIISDVLFTLYKDVYDIFNFAGHLFELSASIIIFKAIYYSSVEYSFKKLIQANKQLKHSKIEMYNMAYYDEITKLPNERHLIEHIHEKITQLKTEKTILVIEIGRLQTIKSSLGSFYSEKMLFLVGKRLRKLLPKKYFISKLRVDQFVIFINEEKTKEDILNLCNELQQAMEVPFQIHHFSLVGNINIGIAQYPNHAHNAENLIKYGQFALYEASKMSNSIVFYESSMNEARTERVILENDLLKAIYNNELVLYYQPQINIQSGEVLSTEALIRWNHPKKGIISPVKFIPIAEETGFIIPIGRWVLETACRQTKELQQRLNRPMKVSVNLSVGQLLDQDFANVVGEVLEKTQLQPQYLELEITESIAMNHEQIIPILHSLKKLGVSISVDDFGKGYSSLAYLKDFPIDSLKIDRMFVNQIKEREKIVPLVDTILSMAKHLDLKVVAEGIETMEQLAYMRENDCQLMQGYLVSKPIDYKQFVSHFEEIEDYSKLLIDSVRT